MEYLGRFRCIVMIKYGLFRIVQTKTKMEARAKHDFTATAEDELSFRRGDVLKVSCDMHDLSFEQSPYYINCHKTFEISSCSSRENRTSCNLGKHPPPPAHTP